MSEPQTDSTAQEQPRAPAFARARAVIAARIGDLRTQFSRKNLRRNVRYAALPLLATTAFTTLAIDGNPTAPAAPAWSHSSYNTPGISNNGHAATTENPLESLTCYRAQRTERHPVATMTNREDWRGFYELSRSGPYGRAFHQSARELGLAICETDDGTLVRNYDATNRLSGISEDGSVALNIREAAHGITHALMQQHGLSAPSADEALFSRLNRHLTAEAIAMTAEYVVAFEMFNNGDSSLLNTLRSENHPAFQHFREVYNREVRANPGNATAVINTAAGSTISYLLRQRAFVEANSDIVLRAYLGEIGIGGGRRPRDNRNFDQDDVENMGKVGRRSFAADARLLSFDELATIAPDTARMVESMQTMHARANSYRTPATRLAQNPYEAVSHTQVQDQLNHSGGVYNMRQAFERARHSTTYRYNGRTFQMGETFRYGVQADYSRAQTPAVALPLWEQLDSLRTNSPTMGVPMLDFAARANIVMCYGNLGRTLRGQWQPDAGIIVSNIDDRNHVTTRTLGHELLHLMQNANGIGTFYNTSSIYALQTGSLAREAAASTISLLIALEFKVRGDDSLWNLGNEQHYGERMLQVYNDTRASGAMHEQSLEAAGLEGYHLMYSRQWWLNSYNDGVAKDVVERLASGWLRAPEQRGDYPLANVQRAGQVSETFNFTRNVQGHASEQMRFGDSIERRELFAWLNLQHLQRTLGPAHGRVMTERAMLTQQRNPYLAVDFNELVSHFNADKGRSILFIANYLSGRTPRPDVLPTPQPTPPAQAPTPTCRGL